ncbi:hypothetical protein [Amycolatopsis methanolica]|uniref:hypothetical protein n=1 Tax=Amycolatopsis methanolica TaxID=1814 RepID=UPI00343A8E88
MSVTHPQTTPDADAGDLSGFGYGQQLKRKIGSYGSFAAGFSFVSFLTTVFQLFFFGFSFAGPAFCGRAASVGGCGAGPRAG